MIGCEFATIFSGFGQTRVELLNERKPRLLPSEDEDLSSLIERNLTRLGVTIHNGGELRDLDVAQDGALVDAYVETDGVMRKITVEKVLFSIGRIPNTDGVGLEEVGCTLTKRGGVRVEENSGRSVDCPSVFAAGDATVEIGLVNVAEMEARHAVECMFSEGKDKDACMPLQYNNVSSIMFLIPEVASIGINEQEARRQRIPHLVAKVGLDVVNRSLVNLHGSRNITEKLSPTRCGYVKMITTNCPRRTLLGMRFIGEDAGAIIQAGAIIIGKGLGVDTFEMLHAHPSVTEGVHECARMIQGFKANELCTRSIYKPGVFETCHVHQWLPPAGEEGAGETDATSEGEREVQSPVPSYGINETDSHPQ